MKNLLIKPTRLGIKFIRPQWLTIILFALMMAGAMYFFNYNMGTYHADGKDEESKLIGIGPCLEVTKIEVDNQQVDQYMVVHWGNLFLNISICYAIALMITRVVGKYQRGLLVVIALALCLAFIGALIWSKCVWGYCLLRPRLDKRILACDKILTITAVSTQVTSDGSMSFIVDPDYPVVEKAQGKGERYYWLESRVLIALNKRGKLPDSPDHLETTSLRNLYGTLNDTGLLIDGAQEYDEAKLLRGIVIEALGKNQQRYTFIGVRGGQISNDHYPYYEFLFEPGELTGKLKQLSHIQYFYDVAGLEWLEWYGAFFYLSAITLILSLSIAVPIFPVVRRINSLKVSKTNQSVIRHIRWGILAALIYCTIALLLYFTYTSDRQSYRSFGLAWYYMHYPMVNVCLGLQKLLERMGSSILYDLWLRFKILSIFTMYFSAFVYFWIAQGLACFARVIFSRKQHNLLD
ncbi:hypothetical protein ACFL6U_11355 [Planctomycetota bacterium]